MTHISNQIRIDGPHEAVFDLVTTTRTWPQWHPATTAVAGVTDRPLSLGDQVRETAVIGGRVHEGTWSVVEHQRPIRVLLHIDAGRLEIGYTFSEADSATVLSRELTYRPEDFDGGANNPGGLEARMSSQSEEALQHLKWLVERQLLLDANKRIAREILERAFNQRDFVAVEEGFTAEAAIHDPGVDFRGSAELRGGPSRS